MKKEPGAGSMEQGVDDLNGLSAPYSLLQARVCWGIYLLLIAVAVGNMSGRLLSVNSVDKSQLETTKLREALDRQRKQLSKEGLTDKQLDFRLGIEEARLRNELQL